MKFLGTSDQNDWLHERNNRKIKVSYDRLEVMLSRYAWRLDTPNNILSNCIGTVVTICGIVATFYSADKIPEWGRTILFFICFIAIVYYAIMFGMWFFRRMSIDKFFKELEKDNEIKKQ